ncbi:hypothetical protein HPB47_020794 [Ixodes persulcatus]|uniref:Uncharacterized protein n=1 Tax=Ixodes persulcatus TaxID=34615 RepID=A0AC60QHP3_IXOPE|nr:hypothetical protein HPB47_020794 [Ixodes persulcatus]
MKMAGLNAVDVYVEWSGHEPEPGRYFFDGEYDLKLFLDFVQDLDLLVLFRPGPYICAERDNGGLPYWLLRKNASMVYRTTDPSFMAEVTRWFDRLLPPMKPYLYEHGGPIILVQVENEYGAYFACDKKYMRELASLLRRHLGHSVPLFLSNQADESHFRCDRVSGVLPTVNMNAHVPVWRAEEGILSSITLDRTVLINWTMVGVPIQSVDNVKTIASLAGLSLRTGVPRFFVTYFHLCEGEAPRDTFLDPSGFVKGVAFVNGINLGRYWPGRGPQVTLYVPASYLHPHPRENTIMLLEMEGTTGVFLSVNLVSEPKLDGPL